MYTGHFYEGLAKWATGMASGDNLKIAEGMKKMLDANWEGQLQREVRDETLYKGNITDSPVNMIERLHKWLKTNKKS